MRILYRFLMQAHYLSIACSLSERTINLKLHWRLSTVAILSVLTISRLLIVQLYRFLNAMYPHNSTSNSLSFPLTLMARSILISCAEGLDIRIYCHYPFLSRLIQREPYNLLIPLVKVYRDIFLLQLHASSFIKALRETCINIFSRMHIYAYKYDETVELF